MIKLLFNHKTKSVVLKHSQLYFDLKKCEVLDNPNLKNMTNYRYDLCTKTNKTKDVDISKDELNYILVLFNNYIKINNKQIFLQDINVTVVIKFKKDKDRLQIHFEGELPVSALNGLLYLTVYNKDLI